MLRTRQTAEIICSALNTTYTLEELLKERALGVYEGLTKRDVQLKYPILWKRQCTINPDDAPYGGESAHDVCLRVKIALTNLYHSYKGKTILIITHGFTSRAIHMFCLNNRIEKLRDFTLGNCEVATYIIHDTMLHESL
jgi:probable phosphoglycerate mutase